MRVPSTLPKGAGAGLVVAVVAAVALAGQDPGPSDSPEPSAASLVGDRSRRVFHRASCPLLKRVSSRSRVELDDLQEAATRKYKPCPACQPTASEAPAEPGAAPAKAATTPGNGGGPFARQIAPILAANCVRCHNPRDKARRKNFDLSTFAGLMKGGDDGPAIVPGKPDDSPLLLRVRGELEPKMPPGQTNLGESAITRIEEWIKSGAKLDEGLDPGTELTKYAPSATELRRMEMAKKAPGELDGQTRETGLSRWKKSTSEVPEVVAGSRFLLFGKLPSDRAKALLKSLDGQAAMLQKLLRTPDGPLAGPEKISLYVFTDEKGYIEFVRANEGREVEAGVEAHANLGVESPYVAAVDPLKGGEEPPATRGKSSRSRKDRDEPEGPSPRSLAALLAEQLASGAASAAGQAPRWLSLGLGAFMASALEPRNPYYQSLRGRVFDLYRQGWMTRTRELLAGQGDTEDIRAIGFGLIEFLMASNRAFFPPFARAIIEDNKQFDNLIQQNLGASPENFSRAWGEFVATRYGRSR